MKVSVDISSEYKEPYAVLYTDKVTDEIQRMIDIFSTNESPVTAFRNEEDMIVLQPKEIYMVRVENGNTINSIADLAGKTIWSTGEGSTPEYILNYLLEANGLTDSVKVEYISDNAELIAKLADGSAGVALLPEPHVSIATAQNENVRVALKVNDLWSEKNDTKLLQGVYIVRSDYLASNKEQVDAFLKDAAESAKKVVSEEDAAAVVVAQGIIGTEPIAKRAIPNCNITLITGAAMKASVSAMLQVLFDANPKSVG